MALDGKTPAEACGIEVKGTTDQFLSFLDERLLSKHRPAAGGPRPDLAAWMDGPGLPADAPRIRAAGFERVDAQIERWSRGAAKAADLDTAGWTIQHWLRFLRGLLGCGFCR